MELESVLEEGLGVELGSKSQPRSESLKISARTDLTDFPAVCFIFVPLIFVMRHCQIQIQNHGNEGKSP